MSTTTIVRLVLALQLVACAAGNRSSDDSDDADTCSICNTPPTPTCVDGCNSIVYTPVGMCVDGNCEYSMASVPCEYGCEPTTGGCRLATDYNPACRGQACGTVIPTCGGICQMGGSGCCTTNDYSKSSGFTASGYGTCCDGTDARTGISDCGDGDDHWVTATAPNCGLAFEGGDNYGGPCVTLTCHHEECDPVPPQLE